MNNYITYTGVAIYIVPARLRTATYFLCTIEMLAAAVNASPILQTKPYVTQWPSLRETWLYLLCASKTLHALQKKARRKLLMAYGQLRLKLMH